MVYANLQMGWFARLAIPSLRRDTSCDRREAVE